MKKIISIIIAVVLMSAIMSVAAFAHGHGNRNRASAVRQYSLCAVENCNTAGLHYHNDVCYSGHYIGDGHDYHQLCNVQDCELAGTHEHDGVTCFGHYAGDGHGYHNYGCGNRGFHH